MIGKLKGIIDSVHDDHAVIDVHGVGYVVFCAARVLQTMVPGEAATLIIETHVREEHFHLYGFTSETEREWFRLLTTVQRVGNKVALAILSAHSPAAIQQAILAGDVTAFSRISGIGGKLAERIVAELKDKAQKLGVDGGQWPEEKKKSSSSVIRHPSSALEDTVSALVHLGYNRSEAYGAAARVAQELGDEAPLDSIIRESLKELAG